MALVLELLGTPRHRELTAERAFAHTAISDPTIMVAVGSKHRNRKVIKPRCDLLEAGDRTSVHKELPQEHVLSVAPRRDGDWELLQVSDDATGGGSESLACHRRHLPTGGLGSCALRRQPPQHVVAHHSQVLCLDRPHSFHPFVVGKENRGVDAQYWMGGRLHHLRTHR